MNPILFANLTYTHVALVLLVGILLFGNRLPELGKTLARTILDFRRVMNGMEDSIAESAGTPASIPPRITLPAPTSERNGQLSEVPGV
jgi:sec-independent protein translocase protein TatA